MGGVSGLTLRPPARIGPDPDPLGLQGVHLLRQLPAAPHKTFPRTSTATSSDLSQDRHADQTKIPMHMFRFWSTDSRGSEGTAGESDPSVSETATTVRPLKRQRPDLADPTTQQCPSSPSPFPSTKRVKTEHYGGLPSPTSASLDGEEEDEKTMSSGPEEPIASEAVAQDGIERARETIQYQFGLEILLKHDELRLVNQELAKCQVALEQLRRCHLIPYPVNCPTPEQMLNISTGKGPALQHRSGNGVPKWAPPFGVVEGPYSRHYAKWLIPDPAFDGMQPEVQMVPDTVRGRVLAEGRTTRNSMDVAAGKRSNRGVGGLKLQALSSGYAQPKDKQSPCVVKRSDGQTVKLVCVDCKRWDFSSTQGFINHCRIAHRRDYKSHEEAAVHCGQPITSDEPDGTVNDDKPAVGTASGLVHPLARKEAESESQACAALGARIQAALELFHAGKHPHSKSIPVFPPSNEASGQPSGFVGSSSTPHLSRFLQMRKFKGDLGEHVNDARTKLNFDEVPYFGEEDEDEDDAETENPNSVANAHKQSPGTARTPAMRVPVRSDTSTVAPASTGMFDLNSASSADRESPAEILQRDEAETPLYDDVDVDLSPNTIISNNAPSLVSDDGEYDDSDDGSASGAEMETDSDVAEISIEDNDDTPRPIHHRAPAGAAVKYKREGTKHVTFVTPIPSSKVQGRRKRKA